MNKFLVRALLHQLQHLHLQLLRHPLYALQRQVALSSLHAAHVGAVDAQYLGD